MEVQEKILEVVKTRFQASQVPAVDTESGHLRHLPFLGSSYRRTGSRSDGRSSQTDIFGGNIKKIDEALLGKVGQEQGFSP